MFRRALLASAAATFAGCGLEPEPPSTPERPTSPPNLFASFEWLPDESAYRVTIESGNRITRTNTAELSVSSAGAETIWATDDGARHGDGEVEPVGSFPVEPNDSVLHRVEERATVHLVWTDPDGDSSISLDAWELESQTGTETAAQTDTTTPTRTETRTTARTPTETSTPEGDE
ncbi:hypothetical protein HUG10_06590 [Halorarum halophilum]|uniref:Lipoprotein n=1 Tax=Halorarum halophilum TaxID=2743090 RepID=A0A7D5GEW7_9EURY|nr:hypothetical protein [Halobaculum halophilum]QLG27230.1 hypothetical protein HUG10_06590 [Halobaculum halophilum]